MIRTGVPVLGWTLLVGGALASSVLLGLRLVPALHTWHHYVIAAATFIPLLWVPALVTCLGLLMVLRSRWRVLGGAVLVASMLVFAWPLRPLPPHSDSPIVTGPALTVLSLNLQYGHADLEEVTALATDEVDVLALQEYTPQFAQQLETSGLLERFPHRAGEARPGAAGSVLLSRTPLEVVAQAEDTVFENLIATTTVEGSQWHLGVIHTAPPQMGADRWDHDAVSVQELATPYLAENLVLVGDFNAIDRHATMLRLTADGALDNLAARRPGQGLQWHPTWPIGSAIPPFARIDHALVSDTVVGGTPRVEAVTGTDHTALHVEVFEVRER